MDRPKVTLFHNPSAGDEGHAADHLIATVQKGGYHCQYVSVKNDNWKDFDRDTDFVIIAGGDGTIRKVVKTILKHEIRPDIGMLPSGTANNVAVSLGLKQDKEQLIAGWKTRQTTPIDVGKIDGIADKDFFLESYGCGLLPALMREMKHADRKHNDEPEKRLQAAQEIFAQLAMNQPTQACKIIIDGKDHSGDYILIEILNMPYVGPNMRLSPTADAGDGHFDIVLVSDEGRQTLSDLLDGAGSVPTLGKGYQVIRGQHIELQWPDNDIHVDDRRIDGQDLQVNIVINTKQLNFLT